MRFRARGSPSLYMTVSFHVGSETETACSVGGRGWPIVFCRGEHVGGADVTKFLEEDTNT